MKHSWNRKELEKERKCVKNIVFIVNSIVNLLYQRKI